MTPDRQSCAGAEAFEEKDFPGFAEAVMRENRVRGMACLGLTEIICGLECLSFCAAHLRLLSLAQSPFLAKVTAEQLCATELGRAQALNAAMLFLWIVSPFYEHGSGTTPARKWWQWRRKLSARDKFNTACAVLLQVPIDRICREILEYVEDTFLDAETPRTGGSDTSYCAFEIHLASELHEHYGYRIDFWNAACPPDKNPLRAPLKIIYQLRKARRKAAGELVSNRSDEIISNALGNGSPRN